MTTTPVSSAVAAAAPPRRVKYVPVVGPRLKKLLVVIFALFALIVVNSVYLLAFRVAGEQYQNWFYLIMFMLHLVLGLLLVVPVVVFGIAHIRNARNRPNKRAIKAGYALFITSLLIFLTGFVLMRIDIGGFRFEVNEATTRAIALWSHIFLPLIAIWLFVLHRLAGRRIKWRVGLSWGAVAAVFAGVMLIVQAQDPRAWNQIGPKEGEKYFFPSLSRTSTGNFIDAKVLQNDKYCLECHADIHHDWSHSVHRFSSFNNPPYEFSVKQTRKAMMDRDGTVQASRWCAGCHDPVPFFSGQFDDPKFDDPDYDLASDQFANAGITCTVCHSITHINSVKGNADYTIDEPVHYPFAFSGNPLLKWVNRQLVKAKPEFHKATFLKPLHSSPEFCGSCHKVHLPPELNDYKWLRGQNHYDAFWVSGVSGHGITSFYYPPKAQTNCNGCHMPLTEVGDGVNFSARVRDDSGVPKTLDHMFPSANTAIPQLVQDKLSDHLGAIAAHQKFLDGVMRVDLFSIRKDGELDGEMIAPIRPEVPELERGETYLLESVIRTVKMGHLFTQGTVDSNEVWMDVTVTAGDHVIGRSGGKKKDDNAVDPWAHYVNVFVIDRYGNRINRRNAQDIFTPLYNNQIPPGAADVVLYKMTVPPEVNEPITVDIKLQYRKFDTEYMRLVEDNPNYFNDLPITTLAHDSVTFPIAGIGQRPLNPESPIELWQRWNDYGIGMLRKGEGRGALRQAAQAFAKVEELGRPDGPLNLARVYINEGLVQTEAPAALERAGAFTPAAPEWSLLWFGAQVASRNGDFDKAIENMREIVRGGFAQAEGRGFDFSKDYNVRTALGNALYQRGLQERGESRQQYMNEAREQFEWALKYDPEQLSAHYGLQQVYRDLGNVEKEQEHAALHQKYKPDDNVTDYAVAQARMRYPAANNAAESIVIYDLQRAGAYELPDRAEELARNE